MKKKFSKEVIIGITVLASLLILFFGIDYLKGINVFKAANYYYVSYTNVSGLTVSSPVTVNGFKVGLVRDIQYEYDNPGHVLVELSLDKQLKVPHGTEALITTDMLGTATVVLNMNDTTSFHNVGDKLIGKTPAGLMDNISSQLMPIMPKIDSLLTAVNTLASDPALLNSVRRLDNITANLETSSALLSKMMNNMSPTLNNVEQISSNLNNITKDLNAVTAELKEMPIDETMNNVYTTTENVKVLTNKLNSPNSSLGLLLNDDALYKNMNSTMSNLDSLFIDIKKNPKRYISIKLL